MTIRMKDFLTEAQYALAVQFVQAVVENDGEPAYRDDLLHHAMHDRTLRDLLLTLIAEGWHGELAPHLATVAVGANSAVPPARSAALQIAAAELHRAGLFFGRIRVRLPASGESIGAYSQYVWADRPSAGYTAARMLAYHLLCRVERLANDARRAALSA